MLAPPLSTMRGKEAKKDRERKKTMNFLLWIMNILSVSVVAYPHLSYLGGPVISSPQIIMLLYGNGTYLPELLLLAPSPNMKSFYHQLLTTYLPPILQQYNTQDITIGQGWFLYQDEILPLNSDLILDDSDVRIALVRYVMNKFDNDTLGQLNHTLFMIHFPLGISVNIPTNTCSYCGYHSSFLLLNTSLLIYYSVLPDLSMGGPCYKYCGSSTIPFENQCSVASHEVMESITDGGIGIGSVGWYDTLWREEVADICNAEEVTFVGTDGFTYVSQKIWSNQFNQCYPLISSVSKASSFTISIYLSILLVVSCLLFLGGW